MLSSSVYHLSDISPVDHPPTGELSVLVIPLSVTDIASNYSCLYAPLQSAVITHCLYTQNRTATGAQ